MTFPSEILQDTHYKISVKSKLAVLACKHGNCQSQGISPLSQLPALLPRVESVRPLVRGSLFFPSPQLYCYIFLFIFTLHLILKDCLKTKVALPEARRIWTCCYISTDPVERGKCVAKLKIDRQPWKPCVHGCCQLL